MKTKLLFALFFSFCITDIIMSQERDILIYVEDSDMSLPLEGATIHIQGHIQDRIQGQSTQLTTDANGNAHITLQENQSATLIISYPGYETKRLNIKARKLDGGAGINESYSVLLRMAGALSNDELVFTADREKSDTQVETGRSVTIANKELARVSQIGLMEDVMTAVKLLPGVGYSGMFNAMPSIRGGEPGDLVASLDGFYIENPYFWGGGVSIFDPRMIESVKLSHGIFSARYGHTTSGLLELTSKKPSTGKPEIELGVSTSAANFNVSIPFGGKGGSNQHGGLMLMGKTTYWDGYIALAKAISYSWDQLEPVRSVTIAPYIRTASFVSNYRINDRAEITLNGFIGGDGVGANYANQLTINGRISNITVDGVWDHLQGFAIAGFIFNPSARTALKISAGGGFEINNTDGGMDYDLKMKQPEGFVENLPPLLQSLAKPEYNIDQQYKMLMKGSTYTAQGLINFDWDIGKGFLLSAGVQELYNNWINDTAFERGIDLGPFDSIPGLGGLPPDDTRSIYINRLINSSTTGHNQGYTTAAYIVSEYKTSQKRFSAELGVRLDHFYFLIEDDSLNTMPVINPRLNVNFNVFRDKGIFDSFDLTAGSGLFSSRTNDVSSMSNASGIKDFEIKPNRSWTSLLGTKITFLDMFSFNIEGYYKNMFDRFYTYSEIVDNARDTKYMFDGVTRVAGFDVMLQKTRGKYIDGWIAYTFTWARFKNTYMSTSDGYVFEGDWRWPSYHHFHNLNVVLNIKPRKSFNIALRMGFATGAPMSVPGKITKSIVFYDRPGNQFIMQEYSRTMYYDDEKRDGYSIPLDIKFSFYRFYKEGKAQCEIYLAIENTLAFVKTRKRNTSFDSYTGQEIQGNDMASYEMPMPMISFGFTWSY